MSIVKSPDPSKWDFRNDRIVPGIKGGDFVTNDSVVIAATPKSEYSQEAIESAGVIGLIQSWNNSQTRNAPEIFEVGSNGKYVIATRKVNGQITLNRVLFDGANLLAVLYAANGAELSGDLDNDIAGYGKFLINLGSSFFSKPLGMIFSFRDSNNDPVGAFFIKGAIIRQHGMNGTANNPMVGENVVLTYERIYPLQHKADANAVGAQKE